MTDAELREWVAFYNLHPFGPDIDWFRTGTLAATMVNVAKGFAGKSGGKTVSPTDFIPNFGKRKPKAGQSLKADLINSFRVKGDGGKR